MTEPLDFGLRIAMRRFGPVKVNPMPMLARASHEKARAWHSSKPRRLQPRPLHPMADVRRCDGYVNQNRNIGWRAGILTQRQGQQAQRMRRRSDNGE